MMMKYLLLTFLILLLNGCNALNFQAEPKIVDNCKYIIMPGIEFEFKQLTDNELNKGYIHVHVAQSKNSATLSANYQGIRGKLTGQVIERNYPKNYTWGHRPNPLKDLLYDDEDFYLSTKQREIRDRKAKYTFQQAILENCQIVYISVDSLTQQSNNLDLIEDSGLKIAL